MTDARDILSQDLIDQIETCAREQGRKPAEILEEAIGRYMASRRLARLAERGETFARARGIREEDIPDVVHGFREEKRGR